MSIDEITNDFRFREEQLLQRSVRSSTETLAALLADDFREFGSSGQIYDKQQVIDAVAAEAPSRRSITDFLAHRLAPDVVLVTYRIVADDKPRDPATESLRSSIWKQINERWQLVFHQGTRAKP